MSTMFQYLVVSLMALGVILPMLAKPQVVLMHIRIVDGQEIATNPVQTLHIPHVSPGSFEQNNVTKRWDGSPAALEWQPAVNRGCTLNAMTNLDDARAGQQLDPPRPQAHSQFLEEDDLKRWGYITRPARSDPKCDMANGKNTFGLEKYLTAMGISAEKKDWKCIRVTHGDTRDNIDLQTYPNPLNPSQQLRATGATFQFAMNAKDGVIVIATQFGPVSQLQYRRPPMTRQDLPQLHLSSDITWLTWKKFYQKGAKLNMIIIWSVINGQSQRLLARAVDPNHEHPDSYRNLKPYPWQGWSGDTTQAAALLGSPNGRGVGFLLAQHKPELGQRRLKAIDAFSADNDEYGREPSFAFWFEDVPSKLE